MCKTCFSTEKKEVKVLNKEELVSVIGGKYSDNNGCEDCWPGCCYCHLIPPEEK